MATQTTKAPAQAQTIEKPSGPDPAKLLNEIIDRADAQGRGSIIAKALDQRIPRIEEVLPPQMKGQAKRLINRAMMTFAMNPDLAECPPDQFVRCVVRAAEMGLAIDGRMCYVVRYKGFYQVQADYKGLIAVARRCGVIRDCKPDIVCVGDKFRCVHENGRDELTHEYGPADRTDPEMVTHAYASFLLPDGTFRVCLMTRKELDKVRNAAPSKSGPWATWTGEMMKKTPVRRGLKMYCEDPGIVSALEDDDDAVEVVGATATPKAETLYNRIQSNGQHKPAERAEGEEIDPETGMPFPTNGKLFTEQGAAEGA